MANGKPLNAPAHTTGFAAWIDRRFPIASFWKTHITGYYAPKNFNFWYFFGSLALLVICVFQKEAIGKRRSIQAANPVVCAGAFSGFPFAIYASPYSSLPITIRVGDRNI